MTKQNNTEKEILEELEFEGILNLPSYTLIKRKVVNIGHQGELIRKDDTINYLKKAIPKILKELKEGFKK